MLTTDICILDRAEFGPSLVCFLTCAWWTLADFSAVNMAAEPLIHILFQGAVKITILDKYLKFGNCCDFQTKMEKILKKSVICLPLNLSIITSGYVFDISLTVFKHRAGVYECSKTEFKYPRGVLKRGIWNHRTDWEPLSRCFTEKHWCSSFLHRKAAKCVNGKF